MSSFSIFLDELNKQHNKEFDLKQSLENKSTSLLTVCGIIIPLLFGFGLFSMKEIEPTYSLLNIVKGLLISVLVLNIVSIFFAIWSSRIRNYRYPFLHSNFFDDDCCLKKDVIKEYTDSKDDEFKGMLIEEYLKSNNFNYKVNEKKAKYIKIGQIIFIISLSLIPILISIIFFFPPPLISIT
jgi:hypothetical protein